MTQSFAAGLALTLIAGIMSGNCMLPTKFTRHWKWENTWLIFSVVSLVVLPWGFAIIFVHHLIAAYRSLSLADLAGPLLLGAGWGIAQILFGISVKRLGLGIAYAIIVGLGAAFGTLVPFFVQQQVHSSEHATAFIVAGVVVMAVGVSLATWGGQIREHHDTVVLEVDSKQGYTAGILLAVVCGVMAPMLNYSFAFGQQIAQASVHVGNTPLRAAYAVWPIALAGGFLPNLVYSLYLLRQKRSWNAFYPVKPDVLWAALMGLLWMGPVALYGMSATLLGHLGTSVGWGLFQIFMILTATLSGVLTGEWRRTPRRAVLLLGGGVAGLCCAIALLAQGSI